MPLNNDKAFFDFLRRLKKNRLSQAEVDEANGYIHPELEPIIITAPRLSEDIGSKKGPLTALVGSVAATLLLTSVPKEEGLEYKAYKDIAGVWTVCSGDTKDVHPGLIETPAGCQARLEAQLVAHAKGAMLCTPTLTASDREYQRAAVTSLAYNIGVGGYCHSTVNKQFNAQNWWNGCQSFISWNKATVNGKLVSVKGLTSRRQREIQICGTNLVSGCTPENLQQRLGSIK